MYHVQGVSYRVLDIMVCPSRRCILMTDFFFRKIRLLYLRILIIVLANII